MSLTLYFHPLASYCHKVLIALYENDTAFEPRIVYLKQEASRETFRKVWPMLRFPVLHDDARGKTIPEFSIIIEYLAQHYPGAVKLLPDDPESVLEVRLRDRFFDEYVHTPMQKIITDRLRPEGRHDEHGVEQARAQLRTAYGWLEQDLRGHEWAVGDGFTMADCAAAPPLFFANQVEPLDGHPQIAAYLLRLMQRPSYARVLKDAEPYFHMVPK
ncbi:MAG: glutathione S-transferase family protein [Rhodanobacteraceae bacterium]